jgi:RNA polymerase sigma-70 factor (ECF subfamily)
MLNADESNGTKDERERAAFDAIYRLYADKVYGFCLRRTGNTALADEARAIVFLEAWRRRREIDFRSKPVAPWLYGVARNVLRNQSRAERRQNATQRSLGRLPRYSEDLTEHLQRRQEMSALLRSLRTLPSAQREVIGLCLLDDDSYEAAAGKLQIPVGTVRSRLSRARVQLASDLRAAAAT